MPYLFRLEKCILLFLNNVRLVPLTSFNIAISHNNILSMEFHLRWPYLTCALLLHKCISKNLHVKNQIFVLNECNC